MIADGRLRRISDRTWEGFLGGYRVLVSDVGGWSAAVLHPRPREYTYVVLSADSLAAAAARARAWIGENPLR